MYVDSSALLKCYVAEPESDQVRGILGASDVLVTARLTQIEVRRDLARLLSSVEHHAARAAFRVDLGAFVLIELDAAVHDRAADIAEHLGVRTLDALHLAAAQRGGGPGSAFLTYDLRQAQGARALGLTVLGA